MVPFPIKNKVGRNIGIQLADALAEYGHDVKEDFDNYRMIDLNLPSSGIYMPDLEVSLVADKERISPIKIEENGDVTFYDIFPDKPKK